MLTRAQRFWKECHRPARRGLAAALAVVVTVATLLSGRSYLWCLTMERPMSACCCASSQAPSDIEASDAGPTVRSSCCDSRRVGALPRTDGARIETAAVPAATVSTMPGTMVAPFVMRAATPSAPQQSRQFLEIRAGPRSASDACVRLQVFRC